jgi:hypothetical protein
MGRGRSGFVSWARIERTPDRSTLTLLLSPPDVVLTMAPRAGRLYVIAARAAEEADGPPPRPPLTGGNTATSSPSPSR